MRVDDRGKERMKQVGEEEERIEGRDEPEENKG
jgi:hypothetical protein